MANIKSAQKRVRQEKKRRQVNLSRRTALKTAAKKVVAAVQANDAEAAQKALREAEAKFARAKGKGTVHANTASRKVSRLAKKVAALNTAAK